MQTNAPVEILKLAEGATFPVTVKCLLPEQTAVDRWVYDNTAYLQGLILEHGALLLRGFDFSDIDRLERIAEAVMGPLISYTDRNTRRSGIKGKIFTAADAGGHMNIPMHCESTYAHSWPGRLFFFCQWPATIGGETPLADVVRVAETIGKKIIQPFIDKGVLYVRNFGDNYLDWKYVFNVDTVAEMEAFCKSADIALEQVKKGKWRTSQKRPAVILHPESKHTVWFNQSDIFAAQLTKMERWNPFFSPFNKTRNCFYGDGSPIPADVINAIKQAYSKHTIDFKWQQHDLLILDNMRIAHGRRPFSGQREIWTGMSMPYRWDMITQAKEVNN